MNIEFPSIAAELMEDAERKLSHSVVLKVNLIRQCEHDIFKNSLDDRSRISAMFMQGKQLNSTFREGGAAISQNMEIQYHEQMSKNIIDDEDPESSLQKKKSKTKQNWGRVRTANRLLQKLKSIQGKSPEEQPDPMNKSSLMTEDIGAS
jgi:hypothetical protein